MKKFSEKILLFQAQVKQDPEAFGKLYDQYVKQIYRFVYFKINSHEDAEDITADVFLKAWNYLQSKKEIKSFSGLLYQIARNTIIDTLRSKSTHPESVELSDTLEIGDRGGWYNDLENKLENQSLINDLKKLKHEYREMITLRFIDELKIAEISEITGKTNLTVRVTLHRALKKLKEILNNKNKVEKKDT